MADEMAVAKAGVSIKRLYEGVVKTLCGMLVCLGTGCERGSPPQGAAPLTDQMRKMVEKDISFQLPEDVVLVLGDDGGGRDPEMGYYLWLFYSKSGIALAPVNVPSPYGHLPNRDVKGIAEWIQSLAKDNIPLGKAASSLSWSDGTYEFQGDLLKTVNGDYLSVQRFRKQK